MENAFDYYCNTYNSTSILYAYSYGEYVTSNYSYDGIVQYEESTNTITVIDEIEMNDVLVSWGVSEYSSNGYFYFNNAMRDILIKKRKLIHIIEYLVQQHKLRAYQHKGIHITINTLAELDYAKKNISKIYK